MLNDVGEPTTPYGLQSLANDAPRAVSSPRALDAQLTQRARSCARSLAVELSAVLHAAFALVVARTADQDDVVFGTLVDRPQPMRARVDRLSARALVIDLEQQLARRSTEPATTRPLLFALFCFGRTSSPAAAVAALGELPLIASIVDDGAALHLEASVAPAIDPEYFCRMMRTALDRLLQAIELDSEAPAWTLDVLDEDQRQRMIIEWNDTERPFPREQCVHRMFEQLCEEHAASPAVVHGNEQLTFAALNEKANAVAHELSLSGVRPGDKVALLIPRSIALVVAELAVLKCGAAYVPIDESAPTERQAFILRDCRAKVLLTSAPRSAPPESDVKHVSIETLAKTNGPTSNLDIELGSDAPAYVMYTSGSTGVPKGCEISHRSIGRLLINNGYATFTKDDRLAFVSNPAFDASIMEVWAPLLTGGCIVVIDRETLLDPARFAAELRERSVSILSLTVGLFNRYATILASIFSRLRYLFVGGDAVDAAIIAEVMRTSPPEHFIHAYGPTETTLFATTYEVTNADRGALSIPIGRPISNTTIYILDRHGRPAPVGVPGELHIGGVGVARGYLNRAALTAERFVADPFSAVPGARLYKTADLARHRSDGNIEFLGRRDHQIKIRGFRVELAEIEARMSAYPSVAEVVVLARQETGGDKRLVAYYTLKLGAEPIPRTALQAHLATWLPSYMIPAAFVRLDAMPLTPNGKLDRRALPAPGAEHSATDAYEPPEDEVERRLASVWIELLNLARVGRRDNFFTLGGNSLLAMTMMDRLHGLGLHAEVSAFFEAPTLMGLADALRTHEDVVIPPNLIPANGVARLTPEMLPLVKFSQEGLDRLTSEVLGGARNVQDVYPLLPLQEGILFHHLLAKQGDAYVLRSPLFFASRERLDSYLDALRALIDRHDILRTSIHWEGLPEPVQVVWRHAALVVEELQPRGDDVLGELRAAFDPARQRLDIRQAPLLRVLVAHDPSRGRWVALQLLHHIASDHTTADMMLREIEVYLAGGFASLPPPEPLRHFAAKVRLGEDQRAHERYFRELLGDVAETTAPFGIIDVQGEGATVTEALSELDPRLTQRLRVQARVRGMSAASLCHLAWSIVLSRTSAKEDVVFGSVLFGRMQGGAGASRALGLFINTLPVRAQLAESTVEEAVGAMHAQLGTLLRHENASLALAQRCSRVPAPAPLFTALFNYFHGTEAEAGPTVPNPVWQGIEFLVEDERTHYPLVLMVNDSGQKLSLKAQAVSPIDPVQVCALMATGLDELLSALERDPQTPVARLDVRSQAERTRAGAQRAYVLDPALRCVPVGVIGQLYLGGLQLRGEALDLLPDPFDGAPEARMYRTEDRARYRADGVIELAGKRAPRKAPRAALSEVEQAYEAPVGSLEEKMAALWEELLSIDRVGRHDNFFKLGGHSLLALRLIARLQSEGLPGKLSSLFASPVLSAFCEAHRGVPRPAASSAAVRRYESPDARVRLVCLPHAGAAASMYSTWASMLPASIELCALQPPGREDRVDEPYPATLDALVAEMIDALGRDHELPLVIFGHSSGAIVAFELARALLHRGAPVRLAIVSCCSAPQLPLPSPLLSALSDTALIDELRKLNGMPEHALRNPDLMELVLPLIRADDALVAAHLTAVHTRDVPALPVPISAIGGLEDRAVKRDALEAWRANTTGDFRLQMVEGDHFYLTNHAKEAVARVVGEIDRAMQVAMSRDEAPAETLHARLAALLADVCGAPLSMLGPNAAPGFTSGWDSVATLSFIAAIEHELGITITTREALHVKTLGEMVALVATKGGR